MGPAVVTVETSAFDGQKPGTSGLRKKTTVFQQEHYVENFVQATLSAVGEDVLRGKELVVGGDGRFYNDVMIQKILRICAANGVGKVVVGQHGLLSTPAVSALIRSLGSAGGFILTASHNPGGADNDCGIKYNVSNGGPAPEGVTAKIFDNTKTISSYKTVEGMADVDLATCGVTAVEVLDGFTVEVVDSTTNYVELMDKVFDLSAIKSLLSRPDFEFTYDGMHGVAGPYARRIFHEELGVPLASLHNCEPSETFGGGHPDPNLTYASELVARMGLTSSGAKSGASPDAIPDFGAAADGDADRNMVLGKEFFVTPSDSLAVIAANANCIPFFRDAGGLKSVARSMPTSAAADLVAERNSFPMFQVPTGWKFFGNLMDSGELGKEDLTPLICGEESFGTGSNHIREKDGIWAVLCWLSILAARNEDPAAPLVSVEDIVKDHWSTFGRNYYSRYDYENVESDKAAKVMDGLTAKIKAFKEQGAAALGMDDAPGFEISDCDEFEYFDKVDGSVSSHQGWRFMFADGSRFVFRLSGTGSVGATIRLYIEKYEKDDIDKPTAVALEGLVKVALDFSDLVALTGRKEPTVIT
ncbi:Phosphoglucomutase [Durusdinium trenchii]|uniref:phosphoglucomutase (alpha-D-glucose-1,6-bisphosphate-dependent) n=1 Tax=Durusdinium trenchii TaxID=1381693 RepID=A0ABP0K7Q4_9DINO